MQLVLEKNKERRNLPPGFILSHVSCRATLTGPLSQYLHVACWSPGPFCHLSTRDSMHHCVVNLIGQNSAAGTDLADPAAAEAGQVATGKEEW